MKVEIKCLEHSKEIQDQIKFDEKHLGFNYSMLLLEHLKEIFGMEEGGLILI